jgi:hypothetical protein
MLTCAMEKNKASDDATVLAIALPPLGGALPPNSGRRLFRHASAPRFFQQRHVSKDLPPLMHLTVKHGERTSGRRRSMLLPRPGGPVEGVLESSRALHSTDAAPAEAAAPAEPEAKPRAKAGRFGRFRWSIQPADTPTTG